MTRSGINNIEYIAIIHQYSHQCARTCISRFPFRERTFVERGSGLFLMQGSGCQHLGLVHIHLVTVLVGRGGETAKFTSEAEELGRWLSAARYSHSHREFDTVQHGPVLVPALALALEVYSSHFAIERSVREHLCYLRASAHVGNSARIWSVRVEKRVRMGCRHWSQHEEDLLVQPHPLVFSKCSIQCWNQRNKLLQKQHA